MFNLQGSELIIILLLALVVLGPEKLPEAMRRAGQFYAELKKMSSGFQEEFRAAVDEPLREMRDTANLLRDSADFRKLESGERDEKPKSAEMVAAPDPSAAPVDDVPTFEPDPGAAPMDDVPTFEPDPSKAPVDDVPTFEPDPGAAPVDDVPTFEPDPSKAPVDDVPTFEPDPSKAPVDDVPTFEPDPSKAPVDDVPTFEPDPGEADPPLDDGRGEPPPAEPRPEPFSSSQQSSAAPRSVPGAAPDPESNPADASDGVDGSEAAADEEPEE